MYVCRLRRVYGVSICRQLTSPEPIQGMSYELAIIGLDDIVNSLSSVPRVSGHVVCLTLTRYQVIVKIIRQLIS